MSRALKLAQRTIFFRTDEVVHRCAGKNAEASKVVMIAITGEYLEIAGLGLQYPGQSWWKETGSGDLCRGQLQYHWAVQGGNSCYARSGRLFAGAGGTTAWSLATMKIRPAQSADLDRLVALLRVIFYH